MVLARCAESEHSQVAQSMFVTSRLNFCESALTTPMTMFHRPSVGGDSPPIQRLPSQSGPAKTYVPYSYFSADIGSTRAARSAGTSPAASATNMSATIDKVSTTGSSNCSWKRSV